LLLTALAHGVVLYFLLQSQPPADASRARGNAMQWLLHTPTAPTPHAAPQPQPQRPRIKPPPAAPRHISPVAEPVAAAPLTPAESAPEPHDPFAQSAAPVPTASADSIRAQARLDAGRIDQELRKTFPVAEPLPPPDSKQARLQRGFDAAHAAVPPKWYQGARMVELSTPDGENKTRTYKISTALLTYCINIYPDGRKNYTNCPR
jgi:hypothetical protein